MYKPSKKVKRHGKEYTFWQESVSCARTLEAKDYLGKKGYKTITLRSPSPEYNYLLYRRKL